MQIRVRVTIVALLLVAGIVLPGSAAGQGTQPLRVYLPIVISGTIQAGSTIRLVATADSYLAEGAADTNMGDEFFLLAGYDREPDTMERTVRTLIRFDVSTIAPEALGTATLRVYYAGYSGLEGQTVLTSVRAAIGPWEEHEVTWANQPMMSGETYGSATIKGDEDWGYRELDITPLVEQWLSGSRENHGVYLLGPEVSGSDAGYRAFLARESLPTNLPYPPELVIQFE